MLVYQRVTVFFSTSHQSEPAQVYAFASILTFDFLQESHVFRMELWKTLVDEFRPKSVDSSNRGRCRDRFCFCHEIQGGFRDDIEDVPQKAMLGSWELRSRGAVRGGCESQEIGQEMC